jgi:hypothetical protein
VPSDEEEDICHMRRRIHVIRGQQLTAAALECHQMRRRIYVI